MDAGDSTDHPQQLLDELQALHRLLGGEMANRITPQDIPVLSDIVIDPTPESGQLAIGSDPHAEPGHADEPASSVDDLTLENIDEEAIQDSASIPMPDTVSADQPQIEKLIEELVAEWLPVLENALRERLQHLTEAELHSLR